MPKATHKSALDVMEYLQQQGAVTGSVIGAPVIRTAIEARVGAREETVKRLFQWMLKFKFIERTENGTFALNFDKAYELSI